MFGNARIYAYATTILQWCGGTKVQIRLVHNEPRVGTDLTEKENKEFPLLLEGDPLGLSNRIDVFDTRFTRSKKISLEAVLESYVEDLMESEEISLNEG